MKLIRFGDRGKEKPGIITETGKRLDVSAYGSDYYEDFFRAGGIELLGEWLETHMGDCPQIDPGARWAAPVARPSKLICIGLNYTQHALEGGMDIPSEPVIFFKSTTAICGPYDNVMIPPGSEKLDWEVELAFVIGKEAYHVNEGQGLNHVAGYLLHNDISERAFQLEQGGQWVKGKSADTFAPLGPFLLSADKVKDPQQLDLWLKVNNKELQNSTTADMIFDVEYIVSYLSKYMTLLPGDVISTGTPSGVGLGLKPPVYLKPGDVMELGITGLGVAKQTVV